MELWEFELSLESPFLTPWQADSLFGHLAWTYREAYGEDKLLSWLNLFKNGNPPFVLSDGWHKGAFPRPLMPPPFKSLTNKREKINQAKLGKRLKKERYLSEANFKLLLHGKELDPTEPLCTAVGSFDTRIMTHNIIDRLTGTSLQKNGLYEIQDTFLTQKEKRNGQENLLSIFVRGQNKEKIEEFHHLLHIVSLTGYGKKRSIGYGQFTIKKKQRREDLDIHADESDAVVWLSHGVPAPCDPIDGWYKLETKYGKLGSSYGLEGSPFKHPLSRILPGAVFKTKNPRPFYGQMIENISPAYSSVLQYGYVLTLPLKLPQWAE